MAPRVCSILASNGAAYSDRVDIVDDVLIGGGRSLGPRCGDSASTADGDSGDPTRVDSSCLVPADSRVRDSLVRP